MKQRRWAMSVWLLAGAIATLSFWFGCEQKGDISPTGANRTVLTFIDTVVVEPRVLGPSETAAVGARVLTETSEPAQNEGVRFSVSRGTLEGARADTTVSTDRLGWARTQFVAPTDTGSLLLRAELLSMSEQRSVSVLVSATASQEGMLTMWAEAETLFADNGVSTSRVFARLRNESHNPIPGATIHFSTTVGSITSPAVTDSLTGTATATLVSTTETGIAVIIAAFGTTTDSARVTFLEPAPASFITVTSSAPTLVAGVDSAVVTARVFDANNLPVVDNTVVSFATSAGTLSYLTARTRGGAVTTVLYAPGSTGATIVTATTGGSVTAGVTVNVVPGPTAAITVLSTADTLWADYTSEATITALVQDAFGNAVAQGTSVSFTAQGGTINPTSTVGPDGRATSVFRAGLTVGPAAVTAAQDAVQSSRVIYLQATVPSSIELTVSPVLLIANGVEQAQLQAAVLDSRGRPVSDGTVVTFTSLYGAITGGAPAMIARTIEPIATNKLMGKQTASKSTDKRSPSETKSVVRNPWGGSSPTNSLFTTTTLNGFAYATLTSPTTARPDTISAATSELEDWRTVTYLAGPAAAIQVNPGVSELPADGVSSTPVTCRVTDAFGNAVSGGLQVSVTSTLGRVTPASGYTNSFGEFSTNLLTSRVRGVCAVVASTDGATGYGQVTFTAPDVALVVLYSDVASLLADGVSTASLTAVATDNFGLPVQGVSVTWQLDPGPGILIPTSTITDSLGQVTALFRSTASSSDAQQTVRATIGSHSDSRSIRLLGVSVSVWPEVAQLPADGYTVTNVSALVRQTSSGFAVTDVPVRFAANLGSISLVGTTDASGIAVVEYRCASQTGTAQITASYGDTLRAQTSVQLTGVVADTLYVTLGANDLLADGVSSTAVTAMVYNESGLPVPNTPVTFTVTGAGYCFPATVLSDSTGQAISTYRSAALTTDQQVGLEVAIERDDDQKAMLLRGVSLNASANQTSLPANGTATAQVTVELRESSSFVAIPGAALQIGTSLGTIPSSVTTNQAGAAVVTFAAGTESGNAEIVVRFGNLLTDTVLIALYTPSAETMTMSSSISSLLANGQDVADVTTVITDQSGAPLRNSVVQWSLTGGGTLASPSTLTNEIGVATNVYTAPAAVTDGQVRVRAVAGSRSDSVSMATRGVTLSLTTEFSTIPANGVTSTVINGHLRETTSMVAITGATVSFGSSLGTVTASDETDNAGLATATLIAGRTAGVATVVARYGSMLTDTIHVSFYAPTVQRILVASEATTLRADGLSHTIVRAWVYDEMDVPLAGATVYWTATAGRAGEVQTVTDETGMTYVTYLTTAATDDRDVTITATSGTTQGTTVIHERGVTINVTATPQMVIADGSSISLIQAHVYETSTSVAASGMTVTFGTTLGTIPNLAVTNSSGLASVSLVSATTTGTAQVTASVGDILTDQVSVQFAPSTPTSLSLTASPTVLLADNASSSMLTAMVTDQSGNPVPNGTQVRFNIPPQSGSLENLRTTTGGVATNLLTSSSTPDTVLITAWAESNPTARDSVTVVYTVGEPAVVILSAQSDTLNADGIEVDSITAHVTDIVGHTLSNVEVLFSTTIGNITASRVTGLDGYATVPFSSPTTGTAQITASAGDATGTYTIYLIPGPPNSITMEYFPNSVGVRGSGRNETLLITATVRDANNNPVIDGTNVYFNINNSPGGGDFLSSTGAIPTINGWAMVSYNSGTISGSVRIRAVCDGISAVSTEILIHAGPPYIENIQYGCATTHMSLAANPCSMFGMDVVGDTVELIALVGDRYNNPVTPGTAVYFTTSAGVITTSTGYTDTSGFARVLLFSGHPLPSIERWTNTLRDPNLGTEILCTPTPPQPGIAKIVASSAGVDANGDSVIVWATTNVIFEYSQPLLYLREASVGGDPNERTLYIGENADIRIATYDYNYWPIVAGSVIRFEAAKGLPYPGKITVGCPDDTSFSISFFNNLTLQDVDAASPVLISVDTRYGDTYTFTETFLLKASLPPTP